ncbi:hypothetical protein QFC19_004787 [Naganishia cerealis]|uniref:Uncharacterized protein n=1 Tax=Naganishia cerealis TaxID=610337 RepID=A0ACC2VUX9_9TREE|nr:hypothetical protein QFC19_004787 [Naganishia cerealis]
MGIGGNQEPSVGGFERLWTADDVTKWYEEELAHGTFDHLPRNEQYQGRLDATVGTAVGPFVCPSDDGHCHVVEQDDGAARGALVHEQDFGAEYPLPAINTELLVPVKNLADSVAGSLQAPLTTMTDDQILGALQILQRLISDSTAGPEVSRAPLLVSSPPSSLIPMPTLDNSDISSIAGLFEAGADDAASDGASDSSGDAYDGIEPGDVLRHY